MLGVLDGLGLVEDAIIELGILEQQHVAAQRAVGGEDEVVVREVLAGLAAIQAGVVEDAQLRARSGRLPASS